MPKPFAPKSGNPSPRAGAARHAISRNAERRPGQGSDTMPSSDWLAESANRSPQGKAKAKPSTPPGVPATSGESTTPAQGQSIESRRGSHKSG